MLAAILLGLAPSRPLSAAIIDVPASQPTLQAAVAAAASGDTILFAPGTYLGGVWFDDKSLVFASRFLTTGDTAYVAQTVLNGLASGYCPGGVSCTGDATFDIGSHAHGGAVIGLTITGAVKGVRSSSFVDVLNCHIIGTQDAVNYSSGGGGTFAHNVFRNQTDDGIDINSRVDALILDNIILNNHEDGIEFRMYPYAGPTLNVVVIGNQFIGNGSDGIQLIDSPDSSSRFIRVERNLFLGNGKATIGFMPGQQTNEDYSGALSGEKVQFVNNTVVGDNYGIVGGGNAVVVNNIFMNIPNKVFRRLSGYSIAAHNLLWNNGVINDSSNVDMGTTILADPLLASDHHPTAGSPAIDAGVASFSWRGDAVVNLAPADYWGSAPDLGAFEFQPGGPVTNLAPAVDAGPNQTITLPSAAALDGTVSDDGLPSPPALSYQWTVGSGPGPVTFLGAGAVDTWATFTVAGSYVLRLTASDGALSTSDSVGITVQAAPAPGAITVERRVAAGSDDAEENATGSMYLNSSDLELVTDASVQKVGMRFTDVTVPRGAVVTRAYVQFEAKEAQSEATALVFQAQAADNAPTFASGAGSVSSRARTVAAASWSPVPWAVGEAGANQRTPDLSAVFQEVVNRAGWASGNALVLIVTGSGHRTAWSYEGKAAGAALLHVEANSGGPVAILPPPVDARPEFALLGVSPTPARGALRIDFSLADGSPATLELLDVAGRRVARRDLASGPGRDRLEVHDRLPAGVYVVRLAQGGRVCVTKAVVVR